MSEKEIQNKKILYLVTQTKWGGAQKYVLELAEYFSKNNEVHIGFGETEQKNQRFLDSCEKLNITTIPIKQLVRKIDPKKDLKTILEIGRVLSKNHYNLVHLNSSKAGLLGALAANKYNYNPLNIRVKIVYTAHGFVFNEPLSKLKKRIYKMSEKFSTNLQHAVITVSEFDKQSAIDNKICSPHKMFVVHNGLDFSKYDFLTREQAREELKLDYKTKYFGTIGSFYETKGYKYLIEAIKLLKNENSPLLKKHQWILIGDGPEKEDIVKRISDAQLQNFIKIIPPKDNDWKYLKAFDYFILPSVKEGLPYTILEAGLAKIPTIASKVGGIPEILTNEKTGLLTSPANPLSLVEAIKKLANSDDLSQKLAEENYQNINNNFDLNKTLKQTEEVYGKLL